MTDLSQYKTLVFDCDGVVLNSNQLKIQAYYATAQNYGASHQQSQALVDYHVEYGGISRFVKFDHFLREIMHKPVSDADIQFLLADFGREVERRLLGCEIAPGLHELKKAMPHTRWMMISGGDQDELRRLLAQRNLDHLFDAGIFGSPDNKDQVMAREMASGSLAKPAIFFGDSKYDHQSSGRAGLDFIFFSDWTDVDGWQQYCRENAITILPRLASLLDTRP
ncbi:MAG: HAD family hydrolase [Methylophilaceae bacterium]|nr:HAD hydrolase-like protein [Methyloradius sp.]